MATVEAATLWLHIGAGFVALFGGLGAIATEKGGPRHRQFGRAFVYAMAVVAGTALALYPLRPTDRRLFLALVAVFSFYFAFSGYRTLSRKRPGDDPAVADWAGVGLLGLASVGLVGMGAGQYLARVDFAVVLLVFGVLGSAFAGADAWRFRQERESGAWVSDHLVRMGAGYIAAVSAFSAVNFLFLPPVLRWLWPTLVGSPLLFVAARHYERQFGVAG